MRSPGTAPPSGAKRTGRSPLMPRIGIDGPFAALTPGTLNLTEVSLRKDHQLASDLRLRRHGRGALLLVVGIHGAGDVGGLHFAAADRRHHVFDRGARQPRQRAGELLVGIGDLGALEQPLDDAPAEAGILRAHRGARGAADRGARLAGDHDRLPGRRRRRLRLRGDDLDLVAVDEFRHQRRDLAVDLAADRGVADVGVHRIGKVDRASPCAAARSACPWA